MIVSINRQRPLTLLYNSAILMLIVHLYTNFKNMSDHDLLKNIDQKLTAILATLINLSKEQTNREKIEIVLANSGITTKDIANIINKKLGAVHKTLQRSK